jgi:hypothetical protein
MKFSKTEFYKKYFYYGIFFLFIEVLVIIRNLAEGFNYFFWFCDFVPVLLALAFFLKDNDFVKGIINIGLIMQIGFMFDFMHILLFGYSFFSVNKEILSLSYSLIALTFFIHFSTIFAFLWTYKEKPSKKTLFYSFFILILIYISTLLFTLPADNVNFVFSEVSLFSYFTINIPHYTLWWILIAFILLVIPAQFIQYLAYRYYKKSLSKLRPRFKKDI